jgi:hypothetical protein
MDKISLVVLVLAGLTFCSAHAASDPEPEPIPVTAARPAELPLELYTSIREKLDRVAIAGEPAAQGEDAEAARARALMAKAAASAALSEQVRTHEAMLLSALHAPQALQRGLAARALSYASEKRPAVDALIAALAEDGDGSVRAFAAQSLGALADARGVDALLKALDDDDAEVRGNAIVALGRIKDDRAVPGLIRILKAEQTATLRIQAALALAGIPGVKPGELLPVMEEERDERVKMAIAAAIKALGGSEAGFEEVPDPDEYQERLATLSKDMQNVHDKLRDDRHDETVQVDQRDIDDKLSEMINELEKMKQAQVSKSNEPDEEKRRRMQLIGGSAQASSRPRPDSKLSSGPGAGEGRVNPLEVTRTQDRWASLPAKEREELLQIYRPDVPVRWRKRLEAYFVSIAAEEGKSSSQPPSDAAKPEASPKP